MLETTEYKDNQFDTAWLDRRIAADKKRQESSSADAESSRSEFPSHVAVVVAAFVRAFQLLVSRPREYAAFAARGQAPPSSLLLTSCIVEPDLIYKGIKCVGAHPAS